MNVLVLASARKHSSYPFRLQHRTFRSCPNVCGVGGCGMVKTRWLLGKLRWDLVPSRSHLNFLWPAGSLVAFSSFLHAGGGESPMIQVAFPLNFYRPLKKGYSLTEACQNENAGKHSEAAQNELDNLACLANIMMDAGVGFIRRNYHT